MRTAAIAGALLLAAGCAAQPVAQPSAGPAPSPAAVDEALHAYLAQALKDPASLTQFRIVTPPRAVSWYRGLLAGNDYDAAWLVCFEFNAKNSFGGYAGAKTERAMLRAMPDGTTRIVPNVNWAMVHEGC